MLQTSLAGNTKLAIIACINPARGYLEESKTTLDFAVSAKGIRMSAAVNACTDDAGKMRALQKELVSVRAQLVQLQAAAATPSLVSTVAGGSAPPVDGSSPTPPPADSSALIAAYEAQLAAMRARMLIGGTAQRAVSAECLLEFGRVRSALVAGHQAAMGRSKRHRETWCPTSGAANATGGGSAGLLRRSFLADLRKARGASVIESADGSEDESGGDGEGVDADAEIADNVDVPPVAKSLRSEDSHGVAHDASAPDAAASLAELHEHYDALLGRNEEMEMELARVEAALADARAATDAAREELVSVNASSSRWKAEYDELADAFEAATNDLGAAQTTIRTLTTAESQMREAALTSAAEAAELRQALAAAAVEAADLRAALDNASAAASVERVAAAARISAVEAVAEADRMAAARHASALQFKIAGLESDAEAIDAAAEASANQLAERDAALAAALSALDEVRTAASVDAATLRATIEKADGGALEVANLRIALGLAEEAANEARAAAADAAKSTLEIRESADASIARISNEASTAAAADAAASEHAAAVASCATSLLCALRAAVSVRSDNDERSAAALAANINRFVELWQDGSAPPGAVGWSAQFNALEASSAALAPIHAASFAELAVNLRAASDDLLLELMDAGEAVGTLGERLSEAVFARDAAVADAAAAEARAIDAETARATAEAFAVAAADAQRSAEAAAQEAKENAEKAFAAADMATSEKTSALASLARAEETLASRPAHGSLLTAYQQEISSLKCEAGLLQDTSATAVEEASRARSSAAEAQAKVSALSQTLEDVRAELANARTEALAARAQSERATETLASAASLEEAARSNVNELETLRAARAELTLLLAAADARETTRVHLEEQIRIVTKARDALAEENAALALDATQYGNRLAAVSARFDEATRECAAAKEEVSIASAALVRRELELGSLHASLESAAAQLIAARADALSAAAAAQDARTALSVEQSDAASAAAAAAASADRASAEAARLLAEKEASNTSLQFQLEAVRFFALQRCAFPLPYFNPLSPPPACLPPPSHQAHNAFAAEHATTERLTALVHELESAFSRERSASGAARAAADEERSRASAALRRAAAAEASAAARGADASATAARADKLAIELSVTSAENERLNSRVERLNKAKLTESQVRRMLTLKREHEEMRVEIASLRAAKSTLEVNAAAFAAALSHDDAAARALGARAAAADARAADVARANAELSTALADAQGAAEDAALALRESRDAEASVNAALTDARARLAAAEALAARSAPLAAALESAITNAMTTLAVAQPAAEDAAPVVRALQRAREMIDALAAHASSLAVAQTATATAAARAEAAATDRARVLESRAAEAATDAAAARAAAEAARRDERAASADASAAVARANDVERAARVAEDRASAAERAAREATRAAAERERAATEAVAERARATTFLEKENLALLMELRSLRATLASAPALLSGTGVGAGAGALGGGARLSIAPRSTIGGAGSGRMSLAGGAITAAAAAAATGPSSGRASLFVPRLSIAANRGGPPARPALSALAASNTGVTRALDTSVGDLLSFPNQENAAPAVAKDVANGQPSQEHVSQECAQQ